MVKQAKEAGVDMPKKGASGYDSPGFAAAKAAAAELRRARGEGRN